MEIIALFNVFLAGWVSCHFYMAYKLRKALKKVAEDNGMTLDEMANTFLGTQGIDAKVTKVPNLFTETSGNSILLYNKDTDDFVCQAEDLHKLAESVFVYNKIKFALVKHDDKEYWFVEGKVHNDLKEI